MEYNSFLLKHVSELVPFSDQELKKIIKYFTPILLKKKAYVIQIGKKITAEYIVVKGCLKSIAYDEQGKAHILQFAQENWWVSDYIAYASQSLSEQDVYAVEESFILELTADNRKKMCEEVPQMHFFFERKAFGGYIASQKRILSLLRNSAREKYDLLLEQHPELFQRLPNKAIAQYLGVSRETLSRLGKKAKDN